MITLWKHLNILLSSNSTYYLYIVAWSNLYKTVTKWRFSFFSFFLLLLLLLLFFLGHTEVARLGFQLELQLPPTPRPQQCRIPATSVTYTIAHTARSLTHWERPGIEPITSWFLVGFVSTVPQWELQNGDFLILPISSIFDIWLSTVRKKLSLLPHFIYLLSI